jgi:hypothetical protein
MVYGPRNKEELEVAWQFVQFSYENALGDTDVTVLLAPSRSHRGKDPRVPRIGARQSPVRVGQSRQREHRVRCPK